MRTDPYDVGDVVRRNSNGHRLKIVARSAIGLAMLYDVTDLDDEAGRDDTFLIDHRLVRPNHDDDEDRRDRKTQSGGRD